MTKKILKYFYITFVPHWNWTDNIGQGGHQGGGHQRSDTITQAPAAFMFASKPITQMV